MSSTPGAPTPGSGAMFDRIAGRYDLLNRLLSMGQDRRWRRALVRELVLAPGARVLDLATGTADVALAIARRHPGAHVVGLDASPRMLAIGAAKVRDARLADRVELVEGDAQRLAFPDDTFDAACVAFGIRNVPDRPAALREMARVVRPGGRLAILELTDPSGHPMSRMARLHVQHVVPWLGARLSRAGEYEYLRRSIAAFPPPADFAERCRAAGWADVRAITKSFGAVALFVGVAPG